MDTGHRPAVNWPTNASRSPCEHDGQVATIRSHCRWCSDALEFTCWNGKVVRVAFALDCHDREALYIMQL